MESLFSSRRGTNVFYGILFTAALLMLLVGLAPLVLADTITVTNANDNGPGSLRQAIADAAPGDRITFAGDYTIFLDSSLYITKELSIDGTGHAITVSGDSNNDGTRDVNGIFCIDASGIVTLSHLSIVSGTATSWGGGGIYIALGGKLTVQDSFIADNTGSGYPGGGGIYNEGTLIIINSTLTGNAIADGSYSYGGAIYNTGTLTITNSTLSGNTARYGGGIATNASLTMQSSTLSGNAARYGGGIYARGILAITNSTLSGNTASVSGGGIYTFGTLRMTNSTFSGNTASASGGGIYNSGERLDLHNTLIANSAGGGDCVNNNGFVTADHTLIEDSANACGLTDGSDGNVIGQDPNLGPLADNGGATWTHALLTGSPAIDAGDNVLCPSTDQRGGPRPLGCRCDIGAFELATSFTGAHLCLDKMATPAVNVPYHGLVTYTMVLANIGAVSEPQARLTDTLPAEVDFARWVQQPGATVNNDKITWNGSVAAGQALTFTFQVTHTGDYGDSVVNTAQFSSSLQTGRGTGTFRVMCSSTVMVQNANDSGKGSLRQAIQTVCPSGTITFDNPYTIYLSSTLAIHEKDLTIDGAGHTIQVSGDTGNDGSRNVRVFFIGSGSVVTLSHLSIISGTGDVGGGIYVDSGSTLVVRNSILADNTTSTSSAFGGGGIYNFGNLIVQNSLLSNNAALSAGGSIFNQQGSKLTVQDSLITGNTANSGGGICNINGALMITNSTLSNNTASYGGGIYNNIGTLTMTNSTLSGNSASTIGGGIYDNSWGSIKVHLYNTLIANSVSGGDCVKGESIVTAGHTLIEDSANACGLTDGSDGNIVGQDPNLGSLADNGGATWTHALLPGSPAIDAGNNTLCPSTDQRGIQRPLGCRCDIGAFELATSFTGAHLCLNKTAAPAVNVPYHDLVTYTMVLANIGAANEPQARLTDTLPAEVDFARWVQQLGATMNNDEITWSGGVSAGQALTFTFQVTHTGNADDHVVNTAQFSSSLQSGRATANFNVVECTPLLSVQNAADSGIGSLRQAIQAVCPGGVVKFDNHYTIYLSSTLEISKEFTMHGGAPTVG